MAIFMPPELKVGSRPPWVGLSAAVWVQIASGNAYAFPPWVVLSIGVLASFLGYGVIWLAVSDSVHNMPYSVEYVDAVVIKEKFEAE